MFAGHLQSALQLRRGRALDSSIGVAACFCIKYTHQQRSFTGAERLSQEGSAQQSVISKKPLHNGGLSAVASISQKTFPVCVSLAMSAANEYVDAALVKSTFKRLQAQRDNKVSNLQRLKCSVLQLDAVQLAIL
jgi:hypothetical protein